MELDGQRHDSVALTPRIASVSTGESLVCPKTGLDGFWRREYSLPPRIKPRIVLCAEIRYTDYAFPTVLSLVELDYHCLGMTPSILVDTDLSYFVYRA